eukprot:TRINITY_DN17052_c0_g2_i2.p1 TRINITY_DN17052_c0_g2~~TRINITY_DN17052_c0_g2_i2.p1  ORF type:complete len:106 (-),score=34.92 TRINITY_DN17052_c0_g2_i2:164-481(-)
MWTFCLLLVLICFLCLYCVDVVALIFFFFFFKQKTAYEMQRGLVGSEMCIRDRYGIDCEEVGGDIPSVQISAKYGTNVEKLAEKIETLANKIDLEEVHDLSLIHI